MKNMAESGSGAKRPLLNISVSLLCWAYNEEDSIADFLQRATDLLESTVLEYEIVLIDDGGTDRTYEIAESFRGKNPKLRIFRNGTNLDVGLSFKKAVQMASKDFLFWQTVDWAYDIARIRSFLELLGPYDVVAGVRGAPVRNAGCAHQCLPGSQKPFDGRGVAQRSDNPLKAFISYSNYFLIRLLFRVPISDYQNVVFYPTKWVKATALEARSSFGNPELLIKAYWSGKNIKEVPINFIPRSKGKAKGTRISAIMASIRDVFRLWFKWVVLRRLVFSMKGTVVPCSLEECGVDAV